MNTPETGASRRRDLSRHEASRRSELVEQIDQLRTALAAHNLKHSDLLHLVRHNRSTARDNPTWIDRFHDLFSTEADDARPVVVQVVNWGHHTGAPEATARLGIRLPAADEQGLLTLDDQDQPEHAALQATTEAEFMAEMRNLRARSGTSLHQIARRTNKKLPKSTVGAMLKRDRLPPRQEQVQHFVQACGASPEETQLWTLAWQRLAAQRTAKPLAAQTNKAHTDNHRQELVDHKPDKPTFMQHNSHETTDAEAEPSAPFRHPLVSVGAVTLA